MSYDRITQTLELLRQHGNYRSLRGSASEGIDFTSNDYLALASHTELQAEFLATEAGRHAPLTSSASRLLTHERHEYEALEHDLAELYGKPALLFNSGYHANTGLIQALADKRTLIIADRLVHASIIDGYRLSGTRMVRFRHNDIEHLNKLIEQAPGEYDRLLVVGESVYSMDGDSPDMAALTAIKRSDRRVMLYVDEAHAFGVEGPGGAGLCAAAGVTADVDVIIGTLGKAAASSGAFAIMNGELHDFAVNCARSLIFSTALPPICCAWTRFLLPHIAGMGAERAHLKMLGRRLAGALDATRTEGCAPSHIIPYVTGSAESAVRLSKELAAEGLTVLPIRTPTVPPGSERLRISLNAGLTVNDVDRLAHAITSRTA